MRTGARNLTQDRALRPLREYRIFESGNFPPFFISDGGKNYEKDDSALCHVAVFYGSDDVDNCYVFIVRSNQFILARKIS